MRRVRPSTLDNLLKLRSLLIDSKPGVIAEFAKILQGLEDVLLVFSPVRPLAYCHAGVLIRSGSGELVVESLLDKRKVTIVILDDFGREIVQDIFLESTKKEGQNLLVKSIQRQNSWKMTLHKDQRQARGYTMGPAVKLTALLFFRGGLAGPIGKNRLGETITELLFGAEEPWHEEVEQIPQLEDVVLDRSAG